MKSMIKNQHSIFIVQKIYLRLQAPEDLEIMRNLLEKNLCYVSDKMIKNRCTSILSDIASKLDSREINSPNRQVFESKPSSPNGGANNSDPNSPSTTLPK